VRTGRCCGRAQCEISRMHARWQYCTVPALHSVTQMSGRPLPVATGWLGHPFTPYYVGVPDVTLSVGTNGGPAGITHPSCWSHTLPVAQCMQMPTALRQHTSWANGQVGKREQMFPPSRRNRARLPRFVHTGCITSLGDVFTKKLNEAEQVSQRGRRQSTIKRLLALGSRCTEG
jgi:hypothetical protein